MKDLYAFVEARFRRHGSVHRARLFGEEVACFVGREALAETHHIVFAAYAGLWGHMACLAHALSRRAQDACEHAFMPQGDGPLEGHRRAGDAFAGAVVKAFAIEVLRRCGWSVLAQDLPIRRSVVPPVPRGGLRSALRARGAEGPAARVSPRRGGAPLPRRGRRPRRRARAPSRR